MSMNTKGKPMFLSKWDILDVCNKIDECKAELHYFSICALDTHVLDIRYMYIVLHISIRTDNTLALIQLDYPLPMFDLSDMHK